MKRFVKLLTTVMLFTVVLTACGNSKLLDEANTAINNYNSAVESFNKDIQPYNDAVTQIEEANKTLQDTLSSAQTVINQGEEPYDPETLEGLKSSLAAAGEAKVATPEIIGGYETLSITEGAKKDELEAVIAQASSGSEEIAGISIPEIPSVPDYSQVIAEVESSLDIYEDSIQSLKQITAPTDEFVMERLQRVETITEMDAVTPDHDPNGQLNKQGGYIGCIYFTDTQVDRSRVYIAAGEDNVIDIGTDGGGAIEIFATEEEAEVRNNYLANFDGMGAMASGSHYVEGTCIIRTSNILNGTQQKELTAKITEALIAVDK